MSDWMRTTVVIPRDPRGPITPRSVPLVHISSVAGPTGDLRLVWEHDGAEASRQSVPSLIEGATLIADGREDRLAIEYGGEQSPVWGERLGDLDIGRGDWVLYVDQPATQATRLLVQVMLIPVGVR